MVALDLNSGSLASNCAHNSYSLLSLKWDIKSVGGMIQEERQVISKRL